MPKLLNLLIGIAYCSTLNSLDFPLHEAITHQLGIQEIKYIAATGADPDQKDQSGKNVWQLIEDLNCTGQAKRAIRYAINSGLREFFSENFEELHRLGDCGNPQCQVSEAALYLSLPCSYKNRQEILVKVYKLINDTLRLGVCLNLDSHTIDGKGLKSALKQYCKSSYQTKNQNELHRKKQELIKLYRRQLILLLNRYPDRKKIDDDKPEESENSENEILLKDEPNNFFRNGAKEFFIVDEC